MTRAILLLVVVACLTLAAVQASKPADVPTFTLYNTAVPGLTTPAIGVGLGGYGSNPAVGYGGYPECFADANGCDIYSRRVVQEWLQLGGRRLDCSNIYGNDRSVGEAIARSGVDRSELFILEKTGPGGIPLGYNDTMMQFRTILDNLRTDYVDLLLIHWPTQDIPQSMDPYCRRSAMYDERKCRLSTWQAMLDIFDSGRAKAVGVSNFNITHLQEIKDAGLRLPSVNQCPFHLYRSSSQQQLRDYCKANNITFWGYSPLGQSL
jgi:diketogulonate reductase-like aldo/keto reductase